MTGDRILSLWAFVAIDPEDDSEGVIAWTMPDGTLMPLVGADLARVASLKPYARATARGSGRPVTLAHFSVRTDQETYSP